MSVSAQQRLFNQYPVSKPINLDIWYGCSKEEKRNSAIALTYSFLLEGGQITKAPPTKKRKGGRPEIFHKDTRAPAAYERWNRKFFAGDDFTTNGPRFTSKPISDKSVDQRDVAHKAGASHVEFTGAVVEIAGKLVPRSLQGVSHDAGDDISDAYKRAIIHDRLNLNNVDHAHNARLKLAA
jgi:hypothetical protein